MTLVMIILNDNDDVGEVYFDEHVNNDCDGDMGKSGYTE